MAPVILAANANVTEESKKLPPYLGTMYSTLKHISSLYPDRIAYSQPGIPRDGSPAVYESYTFRQALHRVKRLAFGLAKHGVTTGTKVGIMSPGCVAWSLLDYATSAIGAVLVPVYESMNAENIRYVVDHSEMEYLIISPAASRKLNVALGKCVKKLIIIDYCERTRLWCSEHGFLFASNEEALATDMEMLAASPPSLAYPNTPPAPDLFSLLLDLHSSGVSVMPFSELIVMERPEELPPPSKPDDVHTVIYTSGTTGPPKGAILTESNITYAAYAMLMHVRATLFSLRKARYPYLIVPPTTPKADIPRMPCRPVPPPAVPVVPRHLSFLPMAHIFERAIQCVVMMAGCETAFASGSVAMLTADMAAVQPFVMVTVPRVLGKFRDNLEETVRAMPPFKQKLFNHAVASQMAHIKKGRVLKRYDSLVFKKVRETFGGALELLIVGGAPSPDGLIDFWTAVLDAVASHGYGATETSSAFIAAPESHKWGNQGYTLGDNRVSLIDVPHLGYSASSTPPMGEIIVRGPNIFKGFYGDDERTASAFVTMEDVDGVEYQWYRTGDVGRIEPDGSISLIDRVSSIFKLAQGEFVATEQLESIYGESSIISQILVVGDSTRSELVGIIVPNMLYLRKVLSVHKGHDSTKEEDLELLASPMALSIIFGALVKRGEEAKVAGYENLRLIVLDPVEWTPDNNMCTPSIKVRRNIVRDCYASETAALYGCPGSPPAETAGKTGSDSFIKRSNGIIIGSFKERRIAAIVSQKRTYEITSSSFAKAPVMPPQPHHETK